MYVCNNCGNEAIKWSGQCSFCKEWSTLVEFKEAKIKSSQTGGLKKELKTIDQEKIQSENKIITKSNELNTLL
jgi:DNA repair protein RadA/Sms